MGACYLKFARALGYEMSYFNLVFASNEESIRLWDGLGFQRVSLLKKCAKLKVDCWKRLPMLTRL